MYTIIVGQDATGHPSGVNNVATETEAQALIKHLKTGLPLGKRHPDAFYVEDQSADGYECWRHPQYWVVDLIAKTVSFDQTLLDAKEREDHIARLRVERDNLLVESDNHVNPDQWASMDDDSKTEWSDYRQVLRDLPANTADPADPTWPTQPE